MIVLRIFYDGSLFNGFSGSEYSVEWFLRKAISNFLGSFRLSKASRTDPGVSAVGNVISIDSPIDLKPSMINSRLPVGIRAWAWARVNGEFNARRAIRRDYLYITPWLNEDLSLMSRGAELFVGTHDLSNFIVKEKGVSTVVTIMEVSVERVGGFLMFRITGRGFRNKLIRKMVRALMMLGRGELSLEELDDLVNMRRSRPIPPAPPWGLVLLGVSYREEPNWIIDEVSVAEIMSYLRSRIMAQVTGAAVGRIIEETLMAQVAGSLI